VSSLSVKPVLGVSNDLRVGRKMATFQFFLSVQGTADSPTGPDPENTVGDQDTFFLMNIYYVMSFTY